MDKTQNFVTGKVITAPSPATTGTTIVVSNGSLFPNPASFGQYNLCLWDQTGDPTPSNCEIVRVTAKASNDNNATLTVTRAQEGTTALGIAVGWKAYYSLTAKYFDDLAAQLASQSESISTNASDIASLQTNKVDKVTGKGLSTNDFTTAEKTKLANIEAQAQVNKIEAITLNGAAQTIVDKTVALTVITNSVNDLVNYYTKTQTYTKTEVDNLVSTIPKFAIQVVTSLPTTDISTTTIYLLKTSTTETGNLYTEYIYVNNAWEQLGTQTLDLSGYVTTSDLNTALAAYTTTSNLNTLLAAKQDTLNFDNVPTDNSGNPVKSGGVFNALAGKQDTLNFDSSPTSGSDNPVKSGGVFAALQGKQDTLQWDTAPVNGSLKPVTSGGLFTTLAGKQDALSSSNAGVNINIASGVISATNFYNGTCSTAATTAAKVVVCSDFVLTTGATIAVLFTNANTATSAVTLNVNSTGAKNVRATGTTNLNGNYWQANSVVIFRYDGNYWRAVNLAPATTSYYGPTRLTDSTSSTSTTTAATPSSVKTAYDLAYTANIAATTALDAANSKFNISNFVHHEAVTGTVNGTNKAFTIANTPLGGYVDVIVGKALYIQGIDYTVSNTTITFTTAPALLSDGTAPSIRATYWKAS